MRCLCAERQNWSPLQRCEFTDTSGGYTPLVKYNKPEAAQAPHAKRAAGSPYLVY